MDKKEAVKIIGLSVLAGVMTALMIPVSAILLKSLHISYYVILFAIASYLYPIILLIIGIYFVYKIIITAIESKEEKNKEKNTMAFCVYIISLFLYYIIQFGICGAIVHESCSKNQCFQG